MGKYYGIDVDEIFSTMESRFRPEGAEGVDAAFGYDITGKGKWLLTVQQGEMTLEKTEVLSGCDVVVRVDEQTFAGLNAGKIDAVGAMSAGKLKTQGDFNLFAATGRMFRKFVPPGQEVEAEQELIVLKRTISVNQRFATGPIMGNFLQGLKKKQILAVKCPVCGRLQSPPREICAPCRVRNDSWVEIGPGGEMRMLEYCYYASPDPLTGETRETPYGAIGILLDGCKEGEVFWHLLRPDQLDEVEMGIVVGEKVVHGSRLRPVWSDNRTGSINDIRYFEIDK
jgi:uncharacterized OB-fold protein/putative sterol carrier protein